MHTSLMAGALPPGQAEDRKCSRCPCCVESADQAASPVLSSSERSGTVGLGQDPPPASLSLGLASDHRPCF